MPQPRSTRLHVALFLWASVILTGLCDVAQGQSCSGTAPCNTGFDCVRGQCYNLDTVRLTPIDDLHQTSAPSNVRMGFSLYATTQDNTCEPISFTPDLYQTEILDKITMYEDGEKANAEESLTALCPLPGGNFRLNVMVLVDQSDSLGANRALTREAVKSFVEDVLALSGSYQGGIRLNIAGFDGRSTMIPWTNGFLSSEIAIDQAIDDAANIVSFTSTDLYGPYIEAMNTLEQVAPNGVSEDYSALVVFTDGTDRARRLTLADVQAAVAAATNIDRYYAVALEGESATEFQDFLSVAGTDANFQVSADTTGLEDAFSQIAQTLIRGSGNVFVLLYCSSRRGGNDVDFHLTFANQGNSAAYYRGDTAVFTGPCTAATVEAFSTQCANIILTDAQRAGGCTPADPVPALVTRSVSSPTMSECVWQPCPEVACADGFECLQGYCVDTSTVVAREIAHQVTQPSNVMVGFSLVATMQDGTCGPVAYPASRTNEVEQKIVVRENDEPASSSETFTGLSNLGTTLRISLLVDQSGSLADQAEVIRAAVLRFVQELFSAPDTTPSLKISGFDGRANLIPWTNNQYLTDQTALENAVTNADLTSTQISSNLYDAYIQELTALSNLPNTGFLDYKAMVVLTDGTDRARRRTLADVQAQVAQTQVYALMSVYITGDLGPDSVTFLATSGRDGEFHSTTVANQQTELAAAFKAVAWQLSAKARSTYVKLFCSAVRSGLVDFEFTYDGGDPTAFSYDTATFDTSNPNNQCREALADQCTDCDTLLNLDTARGRSALMTSQACPDCGGNVGFGGPACTTDYNECSVLTHCDWYRGDRCHTDAVCTDTVGSFRCDCTGDLIGDGVSVCTVQPTCTTGTELSGFSCVNINECARQTDNCDGNALCTDTDGSFTCACVEPYVGTGVTCDIDECAMQTDNCDGNARCSNVQGSFTCVCNVGYAGSGVTCDENECVLGSNNCHENANCRDTLGSFACTCEDGYDGDGVAECKRDRSGAADVEWWQWMLVGLGALLLLALLAWLCASCKQPPPPRAAPMVHQPPPQMYYTMPPQMIELPPPPPPAEYLVPVVKTQVRTVLVPTGGSAEPMAPSIYASAEPVHYPPIGGSAMPMSMAGGSAYPMPPPPQFVGRGSAVPMAPPPMMGGSAQPMMPPMMGGSAQPMMPPPPFNMSSEPQIAPGGFAPVQLQSRASAAPQYPPASAFSYEPGPAQHFR